MRAIFLIKSPLQYLNALEARAHFGVSGAESLLLLLADRKSRGQLMELVAEDAGWGGVAALSDMRLFPHEHNLVGGGGLLLENKLFAIWKLSNLGKSLKQVKYVFLGDMGNPLMRHFSHAVPHQETILLDDGTATLKYASLRQGGEQKKPKLAKIIKLLGKQLFLGLRDQQLGKVTFFTVYDVPVAAPDRVEKNNFSQLRKQIQSTPSVPEVYFLGSPLVEADIFSKEEYLEQLRHVAEKLAGRTIRYIAHRRENPQKIRSIQTLLGWETELFDFPIEYQLAKKGPLPDILASFTSSALENCHRLFGEQLMIRAYRFDPTLISRKPTTVSDSVDAVFRNFETHVGGFFQIIQFED